MIKNYYTFRTGSSGIYVKNARDVVVAGNTISRAVQRFYQECLTIYNVHGFDVVGNEVRDRPTFPGANGGEGIDAKSGSRDETIRGNRVIDVARFGIYVDGFGEECSNIDLLNNFVRNCGFGLSVASEVGGETSGIFLHGNVVLECPTGLFLVAHQFDFDGPHPVSDIRVEFNTFIRNNGWGINIANPDVSGLKINNNIIFDNNDEIPIRLHPKVDAIQIGLEFENNMFKRGVTPFDAGNITVVNDTYQLFVQGLADDHPGWDDPLYFSPRIRSKACDRGWDTPIGDVSVDGGVVTRRERSGRKRQTSNFTPFGGKQDLGAREGTFLRINN